MYKPPYTAKSLNLKVDGNHYVYGHVWWVYEVGIFEGRLIQNAKLTLRVETRGSPLKYVFLLDFIAFCYFWVPHIVFPSILISFEVQGDAPTMVRAPARRSSRHPRAPKQGT